MTLTNNWVTKVVLGSTLGLTLVLAVWLFTVTPKVYAACGTQYLHGGECRGRYDLQYYEPSCYYETGHTQKVKYVRYRYDRYLNPDTYRKTGEYTESSYVCFQGFNCPGFCN